MRSAWAVAYRVAVIVLLGTIALQLGAWDSIRANIVTGERALRTVGQPEEGPAPAPRPSGIEEMHQGGTDAALLDMAGRGASAAGVAR